MCGSTPDRDPEPLRGIRYVESVGSTVTGTRGSGGSTGGRRGTVEKQPAVYIVASKRNGTLYVGVTSDLASRAWEHRNNAVEGFTKRYGIHRLVWYELHETMEPALEREKRLKRWRRDWKVQLIEKENPLWEDLSYTIG